MDGEDSLMDYITRVYRVELQAYNSRSSVPGMWFVYDVLADSPKEAAERLPRVHFGTLVAGDCKHPQPCFISREAHKHPAYYPEWSVVDIRCRVGPRKVSQLRRPMVWLGKSRCVLIERGHYAKVED